MSTGLSWGVRRRLYQQAAAQIENGKAITQVLEDFNERLKRRGRTRSAAIIHGIYEQLCKGDTLVVAMGGGLGDLERSILASGEEAGQLPHVMRLVVDIRERTTRMRRQLASTFFAPSVYLLAFYAVLFIIGDEVVPQFTMISSVDSWTGWAYALYAMGQVATGWTGPVVLACTLGLAAVTFRSLPRWTGMGMGLTSIPGRAFCDAHVFPFTACRDVAGFAWLLSFTALLRAGVPDIAALASQIETASPWLASRLRPVETGLRHGLDLAAAMRRSGLGFPSPDLIDEIGAYVGYPDFAEKIDAIARAYAVTLERELILKGLVFSIAFSLVMFSAFMVLQLGANSISSTLMSSVGAM
jgi:type II secretory pathway component PulF